MTEPFADILTVGGKSNSLGRSIEVIDAVLAEQSRLGELYDCTFHDDPWVRMRAADSLEKVCRIHPDWLEPYMDRFIDDLGSSTQPSIQWHLAQMYRQVSLSPSQLEAVISWMTNLLQSAQIDWIVAANAMDAVAQFVREGCMPVNAARGLFEVQTGHASKAVVKRAHKYLDEFDASHAVTP